MTLHWMRDDQGVTTLEYTLVWALMSMISVLVTIWLVRFLINMVAVFAIKLAIYLTGFGNA